MENQSRFQQKISSDLEVLRKEIILVEAVTVDMEDMADTVAMEVTAAHTNIMVEADIFQGRLPYYLQEIFFRLMKNKWFCDRFRYGGYGKK